MQYMLCSENKVSSAFMMSTNVADVVSRLLRAPGLHHGMTSSRQEILCFPERLVSWAASL